MKLVYISDRIMFWRFLGAPLKAVYLSRHVAVVVNDLDGVTMKAELRRNFKDRIIYKITKIKKI